MKLKLFIIALFVLLVAGCSAPASSPTATTQATAVPSATPALQTAAPTGGVRGCSVAKPEPTEAAPVLVPAVSEADYSIGPAGAPVSIVEYCDFQSPICRSMAAVMSNVVHNHPEDVQFVFRPVPLIGRLDKTQLAVQAAIAAGNQGHFWEMYDLLFQRNQEWDSLPPEQFETWLKQMASTALLDAGKFANDLTSQASADKAKELYDAARSFGLQAVPLVIINGTPQGQFALDYQSIESTVSLIALGQHQFTECPPFSIDPSKQYLATLHTEKGDIVVELYPARAPLAVNSFVFLARNGWFDNISFHRVIPGFLAQTGDPSGTGRGNPGYFFEDEFDPELKFDAPGVVAMANQGAGSNGSQFFISYRAVPELDGRYTIFGRVLSGLDVLEQLTPRDPEKNPAAPAGDKLLSVEIEEK